HKVPDQTVSGRLFGLASTDEANEKRRVCRYRELVVCPIAGDTPSSHEKNQTCSLSLQSANAGACQWHRRYKRGGRIWDPASRTTNDANRRSVSVHQSNHAGRAVDAVAACVRDVMSTIPLLSSIAAASPC